MGGDALTAGCMALSQLRADCLYIVISSGQNALKEYGRTLPFLGPVFPLQINLPLIKIMINLLRCQFFTGSSLIILS